MKFIHKDLGNQRRGTTVVVRLSGSAANVQLLDSMNLHNYRNGRKYRYHGGLVTKSPFRMVIPSDGHWHVAVDMRGLKGTARASISVEPGHLPPVRESTLPSLSPIADNLRAMKAVGDILQDTSWDVFIAHATEDKDEVVRPLAAALRANGLAVWYDEYVLTIGASLRRSIDRGLAGSRFGVVVLSPAFFAKNWPQYELDGLVTREMDGAQVILPLWHAVNRDDVAAYSPSLADKLARSIGELTIDDIANEIANLVRSTASEAT